MQNQPSQPNRPKSQIYLQRASEQTNPFLPAVRPALPVVRSSATQRCPTCGAIQPASTSVCMACGAFIQSKAQKKIRCRRCGTRASANLVLCPGCGRELQAASPRVGLLVAPLILVTLFLFLLTRTSLLQPLDWAQSQAATSWNWILTLGNRLDPQITLTTIPAPAVAGSANSNGLLVAAAPAELATPVALLPTATVATATGATVNGENPAPVVAEDSSLAPATATAAATEAATAVPPPATATLAPTATPSPTLTPTSSPVPATATLTKASTPDTTKVAQAAGNEASGSKLVRLQPTATFTPAVTATPTAPVVETVAPTSSPTAAAPTLAPTMRTYTVRAGDTPFAIASQFDLDVIELLAANGLGPEDARRLRVGQELVIPTLGGIPTATPTPAPTATATRALPTWTSTAAAPTPTTTVAARLDAPQLRSPEPDAYLSCGTESTLTWLPVAFIRESDQYRLHLGFVTGYNGDGTEAVTWVLAQLLPANVTLWRMDEGLCGLAPQSNGRQWRWYVEVVEAADGGFRPVSSISPIWGFSWN